MTDVKEVSREQFDKYCSLCDQANALEERVFAAATLAEKLQLRKLKKSLLEAAFKAIEA